MKLVACVVCHYGAEWLSWAIQSVRGVVDETVVVYSIFPSFGHDTSAECPESPEMLQHVTTASGAVFHEPMTIFRSEAEHRAAALRYCQNHHGADLVLVLDADEIWDPYHLVKCVMRIEDAAMPRRNWRVAVRHFWRSVNWVCYDPAMPVRFVDLTEPNNESDGYLGADLGYINHFGYAQSLQIVNYKWQIHGHKNELRPGWFEKYVKWQPGDKDVHPTNENFWDPEPFDRNKIRHLVGDHPYFGDKLIL